MANDWLVDRLYIPGYGHPLEMDATAEQWRARAEYLESMVRLYTNADRLVLQAERCRETAALLEAEGIGCLGELQKR